MTAEVPLETLKSLKCALCNEFLTVPPITTISKDALLHKCGRCQNVETEVSLRNTVFETLAALSTYPCTYPNCKDVLKWSDIEQHEIYCLHRTLKCPVSWTCNDTVSIADLSSHCLSKHKKNLFNDTVLLKFDDPWEKSKITVVLLVANNTQFLVYRVITTENIWVKVFSFLPIENCRYEFDICSESAVCCLSYKNPVELFVERKHCKKCVMSDCDDALHVKSKKKIDDIATDHGYQKINKAMAMQLELMDLKLKIVFDAKQNGTPNGTAL